MERQIQKHVTKACDHGSDEALHPPCGSARAIGPGWRAAKCRHLATVRIHRPPRYPATPPPPHHPWPAPWRASNNNGVLPTRSRMTAPEVFPNGVSSEVCDSICRPARSYRPVLRGWRTGVQASEVMNASAGSQTGPLLMRCQ